MNKLLRLMSILFLAAMIITVVPAGSYTGSVLADGVSGVPVQVLDDPPADPPQQISPGLVEPLRILEQSGFEGPLIAQTIRNTGTRVGFQRDLPQFPIGFSLAGYYPLDNVIVINDEFIDADNRTLGALLAHEGTHLIDDRVFNKDGTRPRQSQRGFDPYSCLAREFDAFGTADRYWNRVFPGGKPTETNIAEEQLNTLLRVESDEEAASLALAIMQSYLRPGGGEQCSVR